MFKASLGNLECVSKEELVVVGARDLALQFRALWPLQREEPVPSTHTRWLKTIC